MAITNGYCSLAQVKAALRITDEVDDGLLEMAVESASRAISTTTPRVTSTRLPPLSLESMRHEMLLLVT